MERIPLSYLPRLALIAAILLGGCTANPDPTSTLTPAPTPLVSPEPTARVIASPSPSPSLSPNEVGSVYLAIGDSVTFGIGVPQPSREGYVRRLADRLARHNPPITETRVFAVPGETASGFLDRRLDDVLTAIGELGARVELVSIGLGANELLRTRRAPDCQADPASMACDGEVASATTAASVALDEVVGGVQEALRKAGSDARILLLAYYNPDVAPIAAATMVGADGVVACDRADARPGLNDRIACVAEDRGVELVDLYAAFLGREDELTRIGAGDVHPNAAGYRVIADSIAEQLERDQ